MNRVLAIFLVTLFTSTISHAEISKDVFDRSFDNVASMYAEKIKELGGIMDLRRQFTYPEYVGSSRRYEGKWIIEMWGGWPHDPLVSEESFALVVCHEFGHQLAGAPYNIGSNEPWASVEGQSDYFATNKCLPEYLRRFGTNAKEEHPLPAAEKICAATGDINCTRIIRASYEFAMVAHQQQKNPEPFFETPDPQIVEITSKEHPQAQCRLDTFVAGYFNLPRPRCWFFAE